MSEKQLVQPSRLNLETLGFPRGLEARRPAFVDLFLHGQSNESYLPASVQESLQLIEASRQRRELYQLLQNIFAKIPVVTTEISGALAADLISEAEITNLYHHATNFLQADPHHARLILYLPFELLPDFSTTDSKSAHQLQAEKDFQVAYRHAWLRLLSEKDLQVNFIDGDILEPELGRGENKWLTKATHLVPLLLKKGMLTLQTVEVILETTTDQELARELKACLLVDLESISEVATETNVMVDEIFTELESKITALKARYAPGSDFIAKMTPGRLKWEKRTQREIAISEAAKALAVQLIENPEKLPRLESLAQPADSPQAVVVAQAILMVGEKLAHTDYAQAVEFVEEYQALLTKLWYQGPLPLKDSLVSGWNHWLHLGLIPGTELQLLKVPTPNLAAPLPVNLEELVQTEFKELLLVSKKIEADPFLHTQVFPVFLLFGSRLKGYGTLDADMDVAIFLKPTTNWELRTEILTRLRAILPEKFAQEKILEFWLEEKNGQLGFKAPPENQTTVVGAPEIHFLLGGVWLGSQSAITSIYEPLVTKYLNLDRLKDRKENARFQLLRLLELDAIHFRLLQKGYRRFYPSWRQPEPVNGQLIDWESDFWDPGFRRVATQVFLSRVFLPDLSSDESSDMPSSEA